MLDSVGGATEERRNGILKERHSLASHWKLLTIWEELSKGVFYINMLYYIMASCKLYPMLSAYIHPMPS